jgi:hypothetical protein
MGVYHPTIEQCRTEPVHPPDRRAVISRANSMRAANWREMQEQFHPRAISVKIALHNGMESGMKHAAFLTHCLGTQP